MTEQEHPTNPLVGYFFTSDYALGWQGEILAEVAPGVFLVHQSHMFIKDSSPELRLVWLDDMRSWQFHRDRDDLSHVAEELWMAAQVEEEQAATEKAISSTTNRIRHFPPVSLEAQAEYRRQAEAGRRRADN